MPDLSALLYAIIVGYVVFAVTSGSVLVARPSLRQTWQHSIIACQAAASAILAIVMLTYVALAAARLGPPMAIAVIVGVIPGYAGAAALLLFARRQWRLSRTSKPGGSADG